MEEERAFGVRGEGGEGYRDVLDELGEGEVRGREVRRVSTEPVGIGSADVKKAHLWSGKEKEKGREREAHELRAHHAFTAPPDLFLPGATLNSSPADAEHPLLPPTPPSSDSSPIVAFANATASLNENERPRYIISSFEDDKKLRR